MAKISITRNEYGNTECIIFVGDVAPEEIGGIISKDVGEYLKTELERDYRGNDTFGRDILDIMQEENVTEWVTYPEDYFIPTYIIKLL